MPDSILIVDDEPSIRELCRHVLEAANYECHTAADTSEAREVVAHLPITLVISDLRMPGESGMELLRSVQKQYPDIATIVITGSSDISNAIEAVRLGAYDYISKPFRTAELPLRVRMALEKRLLVLENRSHRQHLEDKVQEQTQEIQTLYQQEKQRRRDLEKALQAVQEAHLQAQEALLAALGLRDCETQGHCRRVMHYSGLLAKGLELTPEEVIDVERGALLHDIGKIGIPDSILYKPEPLDQDEWALMRQHTIQGAEMIAGIDFLKGASPVVLYHHEKYDGSGYPEGLSGKAIPIGARIFAVADALDAITSKRPYKGALSFMEAREEIAACAGTHFDPEVVEAFLSTPAEVWQGFRDRVENDIRNTGRCPEPNP